MPLRDESPGWRPHVLRGLGRRGLASPLYTGFADPLEVAKSSGLARALSGEFRLIFADHRVRAEATSHTSRVPTCWAPVGRRRARRVELRARALPRLLVGSPARLRARRLCAGASALARPLRQPALRVEPRVADRTGSGRCHCRLPARRNEGLRGDLRDGSCLPLPGPSGRGRWRATSRLRSRRRGDPPSSKGPSRRTWQVAGAVSHLRR